MNHRQVRGLASNPQKLSFSHHLFRWGLSEPLSKTVHLTLTTNTPNCGVERAACPGTLQSLWACLLEHVARLVLQMALTFSLPS